MEKWHIDLSNTFGRNEFAYTIKNTGNTSLRFASPDSFDAGKLRFLQNTINLDFSRPLELFEKANISFGLEQRHEAYSTVAGEELSYATYDIHGEYSHWEHQAAKRQLTFLGTHSLEGHKCSLDLGKKVLLPKHVM